MTTYHVTSLAITWYPIDNRASARVYALVSLNRSPTMLAPVSIPYSGTIFVLYICICHLAVTIETRTISTGVTSFYPLVVDQWKLSDGTYDGIAVSSLDYYAFNNVTNVWTPFPVRKCWLPGLAVHHQFVDENIVHYVSCK